jgi:hypothetical protein
LYLGQFLYTMQPSLTIFGPHIDHGRYYVINDVTELNIVVNHRIQKKYIKIQQTSNFD